VNRLWRLNYLKVISLSIRRQWSPLNYSTHDNVQKLTAPDIAFATTSIQTDKSNSVHHSYLFENVL